MDPNTALALMRSAIAQGREYGRDAARWEDSGDRDRATECLASADGYAVEAIEYAEALDAWLTRGGALPDVWSR